MCRSAIEYGFEHVLVHVMEGKVEGRIRPTSVLLRLLAKMNTLQVIMIFFVIEK